MKCYPGRIFEAAIDSPDSMEYHDYNSGPLSFSLTISIEGSVSVCR